MILLSERQKKILQKLCKHDEGVSMAAIEDSLVISRRTVYREFSELKLYLLQHGLRIESNDGRYWLNGSDENRKKLMTELNNQAAEVTLSSSQRQAAVVCMLLLGTEPIKIFSLAITLGVSENTIQRDLKSIAKALEEYGIEVDAKKSVGVQITGEEVQKRLILCGILTSEINEYEFFDYLNSTDEKPAKSFFLNLLPREILFECVTALKETMIEHNTKSDVQEVQWVLLVAISILRMKTAVINSYSAAKQKGIFKYRQEVLTILDKFGSKIKEKITSGEIDFLAVQLKGLDYHFSNESWSNDYDLQISYDVKELIKWVSDAFGWNFGRDRDLFDRLSKHITLLLKSNTLKLPNTRIETLENVSQQYQELYKAIQGALSKTFPEFTFTPMEEQLILLYFANSYTSDSKIQKMKTLIVCPNGIGTASILKSRLQREIAEIHTVRIAKVSELNNVDLGQYDLILSTVSLPGFSWNYLVVSPLLLDEEVQQVKALIRKLGGRREYVEEQNKKVADAVYDKGQEKLTLLAQEVNEANEFVESVEISKINSTGDLGSTLDLILEVISEKVTSEKQEIKAELLKRIQLAPVGIPRATIALVHATNLNVKRPFFNIYDLTEPIDMLAMDQAPIKVSRILLMLGPTPMTDFQNVLMGTVSGAIVMSNFTTGIFEKGNQEQVRDLIATQFLEQIEIKGK
ncbi:HTH domain-containing protein [Liquorilactobacillus mali]|nr:HTH domain-containing protein [Liquorilactobacillus mali]MDN7145447.1 HTH domain-containing protein [Liquorilactobacillus mali]